jgi:anti-sigma regulatory factor (Ser/Thr protein kinase)
MYPDGVASWITEVKGLDQLNRSTLLLKLSLLSDPRLLCAVRAAVGEVAVIFGFQDAEVRSIVLAVDEALANVIRHAYQGVYDRPIQVSFYRVQVRPGQGGRDALKIQIVDHGAPVEPERLVGRQLDDIRPGGLGLHFIREIMDSVTFRHVGGRNYLRLIKSPTPAKPSGTEEEDS